MLRGVSHSNMRVDYNTVIEHFIGQEGVSHSNRGVDYNQKEQWELLFEVSLIVI